MRVLTKCCNDIELADSCNKHSTENDYNNMYKNCDATCCSQCGKTLQKCDK
jgi:hypothetical protein